MKSENNLLTPFYAFLWIKTVCLSSKCNDFCNFNIVACSIACPCETLVKYHKYITALNITPFPLPPYHVDPILFSTTPVYNYQKTDVHNQMMRVFITALFGVVLHMA